MQAVHETMRRPHLLNSDSIGGAAMAELQQPATTGCQTKPLTQNIACCCTQRRTASLQTKGKAAFHLRNSESSGGPRPSPRAPTMVAPPAPPPPPAPPGRTGLRDQSNAPSCPSKQTIFFSTMRRSMGHTAASLRGSHGREQRRPLQQTSQTRA